MLSLGYGLGQSQDFKDNERARQWFEARDSGLREKSLVVAKINKSKSRFSYLEGQSGGNR